MCDFLVRKGVPFLLLLVVVAEIDTPENFVRKVNFNVLDIMRSCFQRLLNFFL